MNTVDVTQGDKGYDILVSLKDAEGNAIDLTGATAVIKIVEVDSFRNIVNATATIDGTPTLGKVRYTVLADDFKKPGNYRGVVTVTFSPTKVVTTKEFIVTVSKSYGT